MCPFQWFLYVCFVSSSVCVFCLQRCRPVFVFFAPCAYGSVCVCLLIAFAARGANLPVLALRYPLAPEHPAPTAGLWTASYIVQVCRFS